MKYIEYLFEEDLENDDLLGIEAISLVDRPAHQARFIAMGEAKVMMSAVNEEKRLVIGPVLIPGMVKGNPLKGDKGSFSKETITRLMNNYVRNGRNGNTTVNHIDRVEDCYTVQNWQVDRQHGIMAGHGFDDGDARVPDGTWMSAMFIGDDNVWMDCKKGDFQGFSVEGTLKTREVAMSDYDYQMEKAEELFEEIFNDLIK